MGKGRIAGAVVLALTAALFGTGTASAAPAGNAAFPSAGVAVYPESAVGTGCRVLGFCDGVADELDRSATPQYLSMRAGEAVLVTCRSAKVARVVGFFDRGDDVVAGWVDGDQVQMRTGAPLPGCGALN